MKSWLNSQNLELRARSHWPWWNQGLRHWPEISKQGQPTQGTFLRCLRGPSCDLPSQMGRARLIWSQAWIASALWSNQVPMKPSQRSHSILGTLPEVCWWLLQDYGIIRNHSHWMKQIWHCPHKFTVLGHVADTSHMHTQIFLSILKRCCENIGGWGGIYIGTIGTLSEELT